MRQEVLKKLDGYNERHFGKFKSGTLFSRFGMTRRTMKRGWTKYYILRDAIAVLKQRKGYNLPQTMGDILKEFIILRTGENIPRNLFDMFRYHRRRSFFNQFLQTHSERCFNRILQPELSNHATMFFKKLLARLPNGDKRTAIEELKHAFDQEKVETLEDLCNLKTKKGRTLLNILATHQQGPTKEKNPAILTPEIFESSQKPKSFREFIKEFYLTDYMDPSEIHAIIGIRTDAQNLKC